MRILFFLTIVVVPALVSGQTDSSAVNLVEKSFENFRKGSIKKDSLDWEQLYSDYKPRIDTLSSRSSAYALIEELIKEVNDGHSFLYYYGKPSSWGESGDYPESTLLTRMVNSETAYIRIPSIGAQEPDAVKQESLAIRDSVCSILSNNPKNIVVDLTRDFGGNMYPMVVGMQPVIGLGTVGYFDRGQGDRSAWVLSENELLFGENSIVKIEALKNCNKNAEAKVAVLINEFTISSGEALAVALKGMKNTVFIGQPSQGATTANQTFFLDEQTMLFLTVATYADRTGKTYGGKIMPDITVECDDCETDEFDKKVLKAALEWFQSK